MLRVDLARRRRRRGGAARSSCAHARAGAGRQLAAGRLAPLQRGGHLAERESEHVVQQEGGPLQGRQPVERQEQRHRQILGQLGAAVGRGRRGVDDRLGQPGPTYCSRRARAEASMSRQLRAVVVIRKALGSDTSPRSAARQRRYVSCTAS